jgi:hypothetical protein
MDSEECDHVIGDTLAKTQVSVIMEIKPLHKAFN